LHDLNGANDPLIEEKRLLMEIISDDEEEQFKSKRQTDDENADNAVQKMSSGKDIQQLLMQIPPNFSLAEIHGVKKYHPLMVVASEPSRGHRQDQN